MRRKKRGEEGDRTGQDRKGTEAGDRQEHGLEVGPNRKVRVGG